MSWAVGILGILGICFVAALLVLGAAMSNRIR